MAFFEEGSVSFGWGCFRLKVYKCESYKYSAVPPPTAYICLLSLYRFRLVRHSGRSGFRRSRAGLGLRVLGSGPGSPGSSPIPCMGSPGSALVLVFLGVVGNPSVAFCHASIAVLKQLRSTSDHPIIDNKLSDGAGLIRPLLLCALLCS